MRSVLVGSILNLAAAAIPAAAQLCEWSALGHGPDEYVYALSTFDDGDGPALYVGGDFQTVDLLVVNHVAKWDGRGWSRLAEGLRSGIVYSFAIFDGRGAGPALYAGGSFETSGGRPVRGIARWDGSSWQEVGGGIAGGAFKPSVDALCVFDDGGGPALYAGGSFGSVGGRAGTSFIGRWDGESWTPLGDGVGSYVRALAVFDDGGGPALYAAGYLDTAGGRPASHIAKWDGESWSPLTSGTDRYISALAAFDDGTTGAALYAGGTFATAGGVPASYIARWDGEKWAEVGGGVNHVVSALRVMDDGSGPALYVGGGFTQAGELAVSGMARWDGRSWSAIEAGGLTPEGGLEFAMFDDGGGPALHVGGLFHTSAGLREYIARLDCADCPADCDRSGDLTFFDFLCFQNLFAAMDPAADCDGDGEFTFFDFLCFQNAFAAGCP